MAPVKCIVCGSRHSTCGGATAHVGIDENMKETPTMPGPLKRYPSRDRADAFVRLSDAAAKNAGYSPSDALPDRGSAPGSVPAPTEAVVEPTAETPPPAVPADQVPDLPAGAIVPGGPTHRAREARAELDARVAALVAADPGVSYAEIERAKSMSPEELAALSDADRTLAAVETFEARAGLSPEELAVRLGHEPEPAPLADPATTTPEEPAMPETPDPAPAPDAPADVPASPPDKARPAPGRRRRPAEEA